MYQRYLDAMVLVMAHVHVIEFQKRGLPHAHMLIIFDDNDKLRTLDDDYDQIVRTEILYNNEEPELYNAVMRHMIHGPCGELNTREPCMKNGKCKKDFPKRFSQPQSKGMIPIRFIDDRIIGQLHWTTTVMYLLIMVGLYLTIHGYY
ncbi:hypothetical protein LIER_43597 [Lithospermum erythrorhizon]|uniref:Helitron helicase-like domain-containing protein n=1 Tax=Lithospermum erythrorhizon TaxID=34254 RepID=A0AAV3QDK5_LITER